MKKVILKILFFFLLMGLSAPFASGQVLEDYKSDWEEGGIKSWFSDNDRLIVELDLVSFPMGFISFEFPAQSVVFLGDKLWFFSEKDTIFSEKVSQLKSQFNVEKANLIVFKRGIQMGDSKIQKVLQPAELNSDQVLKAELIRNRDFQRQEIRDFFVFAVLLVLFGIALYKLAYPYLFAVMIRPLSLIYAEDFSESGSLQKFFSFDVLFYVVVVNMLTSLAGVLGLLFFKFEWLKTRFTLDFNSMFQLWLAVAGILLMLTILKFIGIRVVAYLFDLEKLEFPHFFYLLRLVAITSAFFVLVSAFFLMNEFSGMKNALSFSFSAFFWIYIAGVVGLFLIMMNRLSFKKYHLFAYLCIAELVPFLVISKWIMVVGQ